MKVSNCEQYSDEWYKARLGKPTASCFSNLITSTGEPSKSLQGYAMTLAAELYAGKPLDAFEGNEWTDRGKELEAHARSSYEFMNDCTIEQVGYIADRCGWIASPDGLVGEEGLVEFKCLKASNHVKTILYYEKHNKCPTDYVQQTQGQLMICQRKWCDLVFYHPELPMLVIRQLPDQKIIDSLQERLMEVIIERDRVYDILQSQSRAA